MQANTHLRCVLQTLTSSNLKKNFRKKNLKQAKKNATQAMLVHRQHTFTFDNCPVYILRERTICVSCTVMNLIEISTILPCMCIIQNFLHSFIVKSVTIAASNAALTNTCIHIIPCACRTLSLTRTLYHLHAQSSHGQSCLRVFVCVYVCELVLVYVILQFLFGL